LHGGGFVGGSLDDVDVTCAGLARRTGMTVVSLDYRLAPEHPFPAALHDTYGAFGWLAEHGGAFGGDGRVVAGGQSSGANLVAAACLMARDRGGPRVTRQVLCYPWLDLGADSSSHRGSDGDVGSRSQWYRSQYLAGQAVTAYAAPLTAADLTDLPPALILGAGLDPVRDDARRYARRLESSGVASSYLEYAGTPHAFLNFPGALSVAWRAMQDIADDLSEALSAAPGAVSG
jgi:acetyl esterase